MTRINGTFRFFPIGQGLFYGGHIMSGDSSFTFVYDCGTEERWKPFLDREIASFQNFPLVYGAVTQLDLAVVSHLHSDHFCGVYDLIQQVGKPRRIILPLIEGDSLVKEIILYGIFSDTAYEITYNVVPFFMQLYAEARNYGEIRERRERIVSFRMRNKENFDEKTEAIVSSNSPLVANLESLSGETIWRFSLLRGSTGRNKPSIIDDIRVEIQSLLCSAGCLNIEQYISEKGAKGFEMIRDIYKKHGFKASSTENNTSTIMLHYPLIGNRRLHYWQNAPRRGFTFYESAATLLTGDSTINKEQAKLLQDLMIEAEPCFFVTQLPHHGAESSFRAVLSYLWSYIVRGLAVVSYGTGNSYQHPSALAVSSFSAGQLVFVNEHHPFTYHLSFD